MERYYNHIKTVTYFNLQQQHFIEADAAVPEIFENIVTHKDKNFANAREVRKLFESAITKQSNRLSVIFGTPGFNSDDLNVLKLIDIQ